MIKKSGEADYKKWLQSPDIRPYVFVRKRNRPAEPGSRHAFPFPKEILLKDPVFIDESGFATQILALENKAFAASGMILPRWAFYDCSIMPGMVVGFAMRTTKLSPEIREVVKIDDSLEWTPLSLFIAIPTNEDNHWVAHNLCSVNSLLPDGDSRFSALGFLTKAFGLWYFNVEYLYGMTQWKSGALKVHTNFGKLQLVTAYTPIHDYPETLTYLVNVNSSYWMDFLDDKSDVKHKMNPSGLIVEPSDQNSIKSLHKKIEKGEGPFYLNPQDFSKDSSIRKIAIYK